MASLLLKVHLRTLRTLMCEETISSHLKFRATFDMLGEEQNSAEDLLAETQLPERDALAKINFTFHRHVTLDPGFQFQPEESLISPAHSLETLSHYQQPKVIAHGQHPTIRNCWS